MISISRHVKSTGKMAVNGTKSDINPFHFHEKFFRSDFQRIKRKGEKERREKKNQRKKNVS